MSRAQATEPTLTSQPVLAQRLLRYALDTLAVLGPAERQTALSDVDGFVEKPSPAQFLRTMRSLRALRQATALHHAQLSRAEQDFARGIETVRRELGAALADALAALPLHDDPTDAELAPRLAGHRLPPAPTGMRLRSLALLLAAHHELADRVAGRAAALRQHLSRAREAQEPKPPKPSKPPRAAAPNRPRRLSRP